MNIGRQMWSYLEQIGFKTISNNDNRLGYLRGYFENNIALGDLCAFKNNIDQGAYVFLYDKTAGIDGTTPDLAIHTVDELDEWLRVEYPEFFN